MCIALDHPLIGEHRPGVDIDPDQIGPRRRRRAERPPRIVPQKVQPDGEARPGAPDVAGEDGEEGGDMRIICIRGERCVAEVLDDESVHPARRDGLRVAHRLILQRGKAGGGAGGGGERLEVDHAEQRHPADLSCRCPARPALDLDAQALCPSASEPLSGAGAVLRSWISVRPRLIA